MGKAKEKVNFKNTMRVFKNLLKSKSNMITIIVYLMVVIASLKQIKTRLSCI